MGNLTTEISGPSQASVVLINPQLAYIVDMVVGLAACYDLAAVWLGGARVSVKPRRGPVVRAERARGLPELAVRHAERPLDHCGGTPIAVELRDHSERLQDFEHPADAVYVFGPEDGSIPATILNRCHRFVTIPTRNRQCMNLQTAVATVLWDRAVKRQEFPTDRLHPGIELEDATGWPP